MTSTATRAPSRGRATRSRGRGLRTRTGCITCRKRHLKCDEQRPLCQNCKRVGKACLYADVSRDLAPSVDPESHTKTHDEVEGVNNTAATTSASRLLQRTIGDSSDAPAPESLGLSYAAHFTSPASAGTASTDQPIGVATARWFDMLAEDAEIEFANIYENGLVYSPHTSSHLNNQCIFQSHSQYQSCAQNPRDANIIPPVTQATANVSEAPAVAIEGAVPWKSPIPLHLRPDEEIMFGRFVTHISQWIDFFDPFKSFATIVPRLALRNTGLLKAILALSIRQTSLGPPENATEASLEDRKALGYYHETLNYVSTAMQYTSYHTSLELLATALIISAFEMLHGSSEDWKRHLQGVFWIQRSQVIHGDSGGLRGAVWWAWLCQDIWAAFRDKRRVFTFWKPETPFANLSPTQLASRSVFMLSRVINFCVKEKDDGDFAATISSRMRGAESLSMMLDEWESLLTSEFMPLPYPETTTHGVVCKPVWIHPPMFACAMQVFHAAWLLVLLNKPSLGGLDEITKRQNQLNKHIDMICGLALALSDYASSTICSMCLYIAGLCTSENQRRQLILVLLKENRSRTGWPVRSLSEELNSIWQEPTTMRVD